MHFTKDIVTRITSFWGAVSTAGPFRGVPQILRLTDGHENAKDRGFFVLSDRGSVLSLTKRRTALGRQANHLTTNQQHG